MANISRLHISTVKRSVSRRGVFNADYWNDAFTEITTDLAALSNQWNASLLPLLLTVPDGSDDALIDAFRNGLDGRTLYVNSAATGNITTLTYFNVGRERPNTVYEQFILVYNALSELNAALLNITDETGLTEEQKQRIGINIFDNLQLSSPTSLDGLTARNQLNIEQVAKDMYGSDFALNDDGVPILDNPVKDMVDALLVLHNGSWSGDVTVNHDTLGTLGSVSTTNATPTTAVTLTSMTGKTANIDVTVVAKQAGLGTERLASRYGIMVDMDSSTVVGPTVVYHTGTPLTIGWTVDANISGANIEIRVIGAAATNINWLVQVLHLDIL